MSNQARLLIRPARVAVLVCTLVAILAATSKARAQCDPQWLPNGIGRAVLGEVRCLGGFDPDGAGPQPLWLIVGGRNVHVLGMPPQKVIAFDGTRWRSLDNQANNFNDFVSSMVVYNNELIVSGTFTSIDGVPTTRIARWNGTAWNSLSGGTLGSTPTIRSLAVYQGFLYVGGFFTNLSQGIARWDGTNWSALPGGGVAGGSGINALSVFNGGLYAGGSFTSIGGVAANNLARWNGATWAQAGEPNGAVTSLASHSGIAIGIDYLFIGGSFTSIGGSAISALARFSPNSRPTWSSQGTLPSGTPDHLLARTSGSSYQLSAIFTFGASSRFNVLDATGWHQLGVIDGQCTCATVFNGQYLVGRDGRYPDTFSNVKAWNSTDWVAVGQGAPNEISAISPANGGDVVAAVRTLTIEGITNSYGASVFRHAPGTDQWSVLGGPFAGSSSIADVRTLITLRNGYVLAGGTFSAAGGVPANNLARWNGTAWSSMGSFSGTVISLAELPSGEVLVGGLFGTVNGSPLQGLAVGNGATWSPLGGGVNGSVSAIKVLANGDVIIVGSFTAAGATPANRVARWDGVSWSAFGSGFPTQTFLTTVETMGDGTLVVGGYTLNASSRTLPFVAAWNGSAWLALGTGIGQIEGQYVLDAQRLPDGSVAFAGVFTEAGGLPVHSIARWDGAWTAMNSGDLTLTGFNTSLVNALVLLPDDTLGAGGLFSHAGGAPSAYFSRWGAPPGCGCGPADFNSDGSLDADDLADYINCFFATPPCARADFNGDGNTDPDDLGDYINAYFAGCL